MISRWIAEIGISTLSGGSVLVTRTLPAGMLLITSLVLLSCTPEDEILSADEIEGLKQALKDQDVQVRRFAYRDIAKLGMGRLSGVFNSRQKAAVAADFVADDRPIEVVEAALEAYAALGFPDTDHVDRVVELITRTQSVQVQSAGLKALAVSGDKDVKELALARLSPTENLKVRLAALEAAGRFGDKFGEALIDSEAVLELIEDREPSIRQAVLDHLNSLARGMDRSMLAAELFERLQEQTNPEICLSILDALKWSGEVRGLNLAGLATRCPTTQENRRIWGHALGVVAAEPEIDLQKLLSLLENPEKIEPAAVLRVLKSKLDAGMPDDNLEYLDSVLSILEKSTPTLDPTWEIRIAALNTLGASAAEARIYLPGLRRMINNQSLAPGTFPPPDFYTALTCAYWRNRESALEDLGNIALLLSSHNAAVQAQTVSIIGFDGEAARKYVVELWQLLHEYSESPALDENGILRARILQAIDKSGTPEPYLAEITKLLRADSPDRFGQMRIAAINLLHNNGVIHIYADDLITMLQRPELDQEVEQKIFDSLKRVPLPAEDFVRLLNYIYNYKGQRRPAYRYLAAYAGAASEENLLLLESLGFFAKTDNRDEDPQRQKKIFRLYHKLIEVEEINPHLRHKIATEMAILGGDVQWSCDFKGLLESAERRLRECKYGREADILKTAKLRLTATYCFYEEGKVVVALFLIFLLLVLMAYLLRGLRVYRV